MAGAVHAGRERTQGGQGGRYPDPGGVIRGRIFLFALFLPLVGLGAGTAVFRLTDWDRAISEAFYDGPERSWPLVDSQPWSTLYRVGCYPAWVLAGFGLGAALGGLVWPRWRPFGEGGIFLVAMLVIGPGLLVNVTLKDHWGRPRPQQTRDFGGPHPFLPVGTVGPRIEGKSFPSGHAAMGFYLMAPAFLLYRRRPGLAAAFLVLGLAYGGLMGLGRIIQGGHFASDVLWSGGVVYFTGLLLAWSRHRLGRKGGAGFPSGELGKWRCPAPGALLGAGRNAGVLAGGGRPPGTAAGSAGR